jgi:ketosteroid isomerase-like protein
MRLICALVLLAGLALPARADDAALKKEVEQVADAYQVCFNIKHDPACIAALYTSDGIMVNPMGTTTPSKYYTGAFQTGFTKLDAKVKEVYPAGSEGAIAVGTYHVTGKDKDAKELDAGGTWTAAYVKEGGKLKVRMLTAVPKPEPAK